MKKILLSFVICLMLSACTGEGGSLDLRKPASLDLEPPEGPPEYRQGWRDGCESGMNVYAADFYKFWKVFEYRQDPKLRGNRIYYQIWKDAYLYCAIYIMSGNAFKI
jgi:hypothetical protein